MRALLKSALRTSGLRREHIAFARMCCERRAIAVVKHRPRTDRSRILCYHSVGTPEWGVNDVAPRLFRRQLEHALEVGYSFATPEQITRSEWTARRLAITFDDGLRSVATNAAPILAELGIPWTVFVVSDWADGNHAFGDGVMLGWRDVERLATAGAQIGSHSVSHPNFGRLSASEAEFQLAESRQVIQSRTGIVPTTFAIPFGQSQDWTEAAAAAAVSVGYKAVYAQAEDTRPAGSIPRTFVSRFDDMLIFDAALRGAFDTWEEWR